VTVLFADIADSTRLADEIGADRMHGVVNEPRRLLRSALRGTINASRRWFMALFGEPVAHEDHARRAALAALAIQDMIGRRSSAFLPADKRLAVRIGINSGAVVVGKIGGNLRWDYTAIGDTTNVAARLQAEAAPNDPAARPLPAPPTLRRVTGERTLKGKPNRSRSRGDWPFPWLRGRSRPDGGPTARWHICPRCKPVAAAGEFSPSSARQMGSRVCCASARRRRRRAGRGASVLGGTLATGRLSCPGRFDRRGRRSVVGPSRASAWWSSTGAGRESALPACRSRC
jgi:hypothetical protein